MSSSVTPTEGSGVLTLPADCPHCKEHFTARIDLSQPLHVQSAKCPGCKLRVMRRALAEQVHDEADTDS